MTKLAITICLIMFLAGVHSGLLAVEDLGFERAVRECERLHPGGSHYTGNGPLRNAEENVYYLLARWLVEFENWCQLRDTRPNRIKQDAPKGKFCND